MKYKRKNKILLLGALLICFYSCNPIETSESIQPTGYEKQLAYYIKYAKIQNKHWNNLCFEKGEENNDLVRLKKLQDQLAALQNQNLSICQEGIVFRIMLLRSFLGKKVSRCFRGNSNPTCLHKEELERFIFDNPLFIGKCFNDFWEANEFKKKLREQGFKDAWLVGFENGQRKDLKYLLEK